MSDEIDAAIETMFSLYDSNSDGRISREEAKLSIGCFEASAEDVEADFQLCDSSGDGFVDRKEYRAFFYKRVVEGGWELEDIQNAIETIRDHLSNQ